MMACRGTNTTAVLGSAAMARQLVMLAVGGPTDHPKSTSPLPSANARAGRGATSKGGRHHYLPEIAPLPWEPHFQGCWPGATNWSLANKHTNFSLFFFALIFPLPPANLQGWPSGPVQVPQAGRDTPRWGRMWGWGWGWKIVVNFLLLYFMVYGDYLERRPTFFHVVDCDYKGALFVPAGTEFQQSGISSLAVNGLPNLGLHILGKSLLAKF